MTTITTKVCHDEGAGTEVTFYEGKDEVGKASTTAFGNKPNIFLYDVEVYEKFRNRGYGYTIVEYMINRYEVNTLHVSNDNIAAIRLYEKFGFRACARFNDTIIMMVRE